MLSTHSTPRFTAPPPRDTRQPEVEILVDVDDSRNTAAQATAAVRMAFGDRVTIDERHALIDAVVAIAPLKREARVAGPADRGRHLHLLVEGWAYRAHGLPDGTRQITHILLPGDICDWEAPAPNEEIRACGPVRVAMLNRGVDGLALQALRRTRDWTMMTELRRLRGQLASLGRRDARERLAYLLADLHGRLERVGLTRGGAFACPLTQDQLADLLGLTSVHINRVLQGLRHDGLLVFSKRRIIIPNLQRLHAVTGWDQAVDDADSAAAHHPIFLSGHLPQMPPPSDYCESRGLS